MDRIHCSLSRLHVDSQVLADKKLQVTVDDQPFLLCLKSVSGELSVRTFWETDYPYDEVESRLFTAADAWNRERYFPTVYILATQQGTATVVADYVTSGRGGLSNQQLDTAVQIGMATGADAMRFMQDAACSVLGMADESFWR